MDTALISLQIALMLFALYKKLPLYGFYSILTCITVLFMVVLGLTGLILSFEPNILILIGLTVSIKSSAVMLVSATSLIMALACCYGLKKQSFPYKVNYPEECC